METNRVTFAVVVMAFALFPVDGIGADPPPHAAMTRATGGPQTLDDYQALAREHNLTVQAGRARAAVAREAVGVATGYPDPSLMYAVTVQPDAVRGRQELEVRQEIPFPGKRGLRGDVASRQADVAYHAAEAIALDAAYDVAANFFDYVRVTETRRVLAGEREVLVRARDIVNVRYSAGTAEQQDVLKIELAISQLDDELVMNEHAQDRVRIQLNELIGRDARAPLPPPTWSMPDATALKASAATDSALVGRPEVASARAGVAMADASRRLAGKDYIPDFMVGGMLEFGADAPEMWQVKAGLTLPIWIGKRRAAVRAADAMRAAAGRELAAAELRVRRQVEDAVHGVYMAEDRLQRFESLILPQAEQTYRSSEAGYRAGRVDFLYYLDSERMVLAMRKEYYNVVAEFGTQVAALRRALGAPR
jgi:outer membrane protein TolC